MVSGAVAGIHGKVMGHDRNHWLEEKVMGRRDRKESKFPISKKQEQKRPRMEVQRR